jgi:hypothetical protein
MENEGTPMSLVKTFNFQKADFFSNPVCIEQSRDPIKMAGIVTYQCCPLTSGMGGDHHIHGADGCAVLLHRSPKVSIMVRRCFIRGDYGQPGDKIVYFLPEGRAKRHFTRLW